MSAQVKNAIVFGVAIVLGAVFAVLVDPPADAELTIQLAYRVIGFLVGFVPVALGLTWLIKKLGI